MELIKSIYTHIFKYNGKCLVYNSENNCFFEISDKIYEYIEHINENKFISVSQETLDMLIKHKIIISKNDKYSYYNRSKLMNCLDRFCSTKLTINIIPTTSCNFKCPYCFEKNKTNKTISDNVIEKLIEFINKHSDSKKLNLMWYGGEPLLAFEKIKIILKLIQDKSIIPLNSHSIITNGYLFDQAKCSFFKKYPLSDIQITIDGEQSQHNKSRYTCNDNNTYERIISNIDVIVEEMPSTRVFIRINIDENNKYSFASLYKKFNERWGGKNVHVYPGFIRIDNENSTNMMAPSIIEDSKRNFYFDLEEDGLKVGYYPELRNKSCSAVRKNSYIIGPEGELYKCWNDVSNPNKIIGNICEDNIKNVDLLAKYLTEGTVFENEKCRDCFYFPICGGGCPQYRLKNKFEGGSYDLCSVRNDKRLDKKYFTECLIKHYELKRSNGSINLINE